jgi:cysteine-rich repeat protein
MKNALLFCGALVACAPRVEITLLSLADVSNPRATLEFTFTAGDQVATVSIPDEPLPIVESITLPKGFESLPLRLEVRALVGEREVASGNVDLSQGQTEATIRFSVCSNGAPEAEELCDDANLTDGDGCDSTCKPTGCNSNVLTPGEVCFSTQNSVVANGPPSNILVEDTNGDQLLDLIASYPTQGKVRVFFGSEDNQFGDFFEVNVNTDARLVSVADLNQDGSFDFVVTTETNFLVFTGNGDGTFTSGQGFFGGLDLRGLALADLDGDQLPEQILLDFEQNRVRTLPGLGDGTFDLSASNTVSVEVQPIALSIVDIDQDGDNDIITANLSGTISVVINDAGILTANTPINANGTPTALTTADFNGDGLLDIGVIKQAGSAFVSIFKQNDSSVSFQEAGDFAAPDSPGGLIAADVDLDEDADIAVTSESGASVTILVNNGQGQFPAEAPTATTTSPKAIAAGDINRDGLIDFVTAGQDLGLIFSTP